MSEHIDNPTQRKERLKRVIQQLHAGKTVDEVKAEFAALLADVGPTEIAENEQALIDEGLPETEIKRLCDVHVAVFKASLEAQPEPEALPGHPVDTFRAENAAAAFYLEALQEALETVKAEPGPAQREQAQDRLAELRQYEKHYLRKENILFPYLEKYGFGGPSSVMWAIHDDVRADWKGLGELLAAGPDDAPEAFAAQLDQLFERLDTAIREMFYKEENILFPTALDMLSQEEWAAVRAQGPDIGYAYLEPGEQWLSHATGGEPSVPAAEEVALRNLFHLDTGLLTHQEINLVLNHLPIEISYVDKSDAVRYFSQTAERVFPRSPAIIGRQVQKCHPPASVHRVQQILDEFRAGERDEAEFWIQMQGRFIHIRYVAVRDESGAYQGILEVVQDVTHIRGLKGEKRLLDEEV